MRHSPVEGRNLRSDSTAGHPDTRHLTTGDTPLHATMAPVIWALLGPTPQDGMKAAVAPGGSMTHCSVRGLTTQPPAGSRVPDQLITQWRSGWTVPDT